MNLEDQLALVYKYIDSSFTYGSDNEWISDLIDDEFQEFLELRGETPTEPEIKEFAIDIQNKLYQREGMAILAQDG